MKALKKKKKSSPFDWLRDLEALDREGPVTKITEPYINTVVQPKTRFIQ